MIAFQEVLSTEICASSKNNALWSRALFKAALFELLIFIEEGLLKLLPKTTGNT